MNQKLQRFFDQMAVQFGCGLYNADRDYPAAERVVKLQIDSFVHEAETAFGKTFDAYEFRAAIKRQHASLQ